MNRYLIRESHKFQLIFEMDQSKAMSGESFQRALSLDNAVDVDKFILKTTQTSQRLI